MSRKQTREIKKKTERDFALVYVGGKKDVSGYAVIPFRYYLIGKYGIIIN